LPIGFEYSAPSSQGFWAVESKVEIKIEVKRIRLFMVVKRNQKLIIFPLIDNK